MPIAEIAAALSATSGAIKLLKGINDTAKKVEINEIVIDLQGTLIDLNGKILDIQSEYEKLTNIKCDVEAKLREEKERNDDRSQYELHQVGSGKLVYNFVGSGRPAHYLCATCFDQKEKSILQVTEQGQTFYECGRSVDHGFTA